MSVNQSGLYIEQLAKLGLWGLFDHNLTANRVDYFGQVVDRSFVASPMGKRAEHYWTEIAAHFPFVKIG